jgi:hypothetical protein
MYPGDNKLYQTLAGHFLWRGFSFCFIALLYKYRSRWRRTS